jgi:hypothetical protein
MPSKAETVLQALVAALSPALPAGAKLLRNENLPERVPPAGIVIVRDGDPGEPEAWLSPPGYYYEHRAEIEAIADGATAALRDAAFDALRLAIGAAIAADRTLGGTVDYALAGSPAPLLLNIDGDQGLKAATIPVVLAYATTDPLL